jgi:hypothetical protein
MRLFAWLAIALPALGADIPKVKFTDTTLDNGLRVLISEDHYARLSMPSASAIRSGRRTSARAAPASPTSSNT